MGRLIGPDEASRKVEVLIGGTFRGKVGKSAQLWADPAATVPADVLWPDGSAVPLQQPTGNGGRGAAPTVLIDALSFLPDVQYPPGDVQVVYVTCDGGPAWPAYARTDDRLDALDGRVATVEGVAAGLGNAATRDVGTTAGTVAAGNDARITAPVNIQSFTVAGSYTWIKPAGARLVEVITIGGGGGGGSGRRGAAGTLRTGGGGGGGGGITRALLNATDLPASCPGVVGVGAGGGSSAAVGNDSNGQGGGTGGHSTFNSTEQGGSNAARVRAGGGAPGAAGGTGQALGGTGGFAQFGGASGANSSSTGLAGGNGGDNAGGAGGGGGGGITSADVPNNGGMGGVNAIIDQWRAGPGVAPGGIGEAGRSSLSMGVGNGAGGGAASTTGAAGAGGQGGGYGGGGGGGGASLNGNPVGAGGRGGDGAVFVITYF